MPRHFPVLRLVVPIAALGAGLSFVVGIVAAVTLLVMGIAGGRLIGGLINGVAAAVAGVAAAFCLAAIGEAAELLVELHARLGGPSGPQRGDDVPDAAHRPREVSGPSETGQGRGPAG